MRSMPVDSSATGRKSSGPALAACTAAGGVVILTGMPITDLLGDPPQITRPTIERGAIYPYGVSGFGGAALVDLDEYLPDLTWPFSVRVFGEMINDAQVDSLYTGLMWPIRQFRWSLKQGDADPTVTQQIADDLGLPTFLGDGKDSVPPPRRPRTFSHAHHLTDSLRAPLYGHYYFELVGSIRDGLWRLDRVAPRPPRTINMIKVTEHGDMTSIQQNLSIMDQPIPASSLALYVWDREGANWFGRSLMRSLYGPWRLKQRLLNVDRMKHERNSMGVPIVTAQKGATKGDLAKAEELASAYRAGDAAGGALPDGVSLALQGVQGATSSPLESVKYYDEVMARRMFQMISMLGSTATGNRALGDAFRDLLDNALRTIADWYVDTTQTEIIEKWVDWNVGPGAPAPHLIYDAQPEMSMETLSTVVKDGVIQPDDALEAWVRDTHHLPPRTQSRAAQKQAEAPAPPPIVAPPAGPTGPPAIAPAIAASAGQPLIGRDGKPVLTATGEPVLIGVDGRAFSRAEQHG